MFVVFLVMVRTVLLYNVQLCSDFICVCACACVFPPDAYENGDEHRANRISDHQVVLLHQEGWDDDADASQRISDNVEKNSCGTASKATSHYWHLIALSPPPSLSRTHTYVCLTIWNSNQFSYKTTVIFGCDSSRVDVFSVNHDAEYKPRVRYLISRNSPCQMKSDEGFTSALPKMAGIQTPCMQEEVCEHQYTWQINGRSVWWMNELVVMAQ